MFLNSIRLILPLQLSPWLEMESNTPINSSKTLSENGNAQCPTQCTSMSLALLESNLEE